MKISDFCLLSCTWLFKTYNLGHQDWQIPHPGAPQTNARSCICRITVCLSFFLSHSFLTFLPAQTCFGNWVTYSQHFKCSLSEEFSLHNGQKLNTIYFLNVNAWPWPVWLCWLGVIPQSNRSPARFPSGHIPGLHVGSPSRLHLRDNWLMYLSHINVSLPLLLRPFPNFSLALLKQKSKCMTLDWKFNKINVSPLVLVFFVKWI